MIKHLKTCTLQFQEDSVISTIKEGVVFGKIESEIQTSEILEVFKNKPFVYITNRINSYSVDPTIYIESSKINNLTGFAVVSTTQSAKTAEVESLFLNKPFKIFSDLSEAKIWAKNIINDILV
jgi:hypothetical protein